MTDKKKNGDDQILEQNVEQLLSRAHQPPKMSEEARGRVLEHLKERLPEQQAEVETLPWRTVGVVLALAASFALVVELFARREDPVVHENAAPQPEQILLADGTEVILDRAAKITTLGRRHLRISKGRALLRVAKGEEPFVVDAPHGRVVVLGTQFVLKAEEAETWTAVMRGEVRIENDQGHATLHAGQQGILQGGKQPTRRAAPRLSHLTSWARLARKQAEGQKKRPVRQGTLLARNPQWQQQDYPLPLRDLTIDVHVENQVARVALDQTFFNPQHSQLEGVYRFPLPPGAAIDRLAMYVEGKLMESAVVERQRGRQIYESIVYRRRDPALLEWMAGNNFQIRIFPLPARTEKRILLSYTQTLDRLYDDYRLEVPIPKVDNEVRKARYVVRLVGCADCMVRSTSHEIQIERQEKDAIVLFEKENYRVGDALLLTVREPQQKPRAVTDGTYWMMRAQPDLRGPDGQSPSTRLRSLHSLRASGLPVSASEPAPHGRRWVVLHDTSASRTSLELKAQTHFIDRFLREVDESDELNLIAFDATVRRMSDSFVSVRDLDRHEVWKFLNSESQDGVGHTDLSRGLQEALALLDAAPQGSLSPHILYLGDGIATGGERRLVELSQRVRGKATVIGAAIGDQVGADLLRALASATGGIFTRINPGDDLDWRVHDLVATLNTARVIDLRAELFDNNGELVSQDLYANSHQLADGEAVSIVARLDAEASQPAKLVLHGTMGGSPWTQTLEVPVPEDQKARYLPRLWAQRRLTDLIATGTEENQEEITALGVEHFLMTPFTSLIVLENDAMYRRFEVKRDRKRQWAAYAVPKKIKVVRESSPRVIQAANVPIDAVMNRTPTNLFFGTVNTGGINDLGGALSNIDGVGFGGGGIGDISGIGGLGLRGVAEPTTTARRTAVTGKVASSGLLKLLGTRGRRDKTWSTGANEPIQPIVGNTRSVGRRRSRRRGGHQSLALNKTTKNFQLHTLLRGGAKSGYYQLASPAAMYYASDPRLADLTEFVPAFFTTLNPPSVEGSISEEAKALMEKMRAAQAELTLHNENAQLERTVNGLQVTSVLESGLVEALRIEKDRVEHRYGELGLVLRHHLAVLTPQLVETWGAYYLPDNELLSLWYEVTTPEARVVQLKNGTQTIRFTLDEQFRVVKIVIKERNEQRTTSLKWGDQLVLKRGEHEESWSLGKGSLTMSEPSSWTMVQMPLRQPAFWLKRAEGLEVGSEKWRYLQRQLLASHAALGQGQELFRVLSALDSATKKVTLGELVLASRGTVTAKKKKVASLLARAENGPVTRYLMANSIFGWHARRTAFDTVKGAPGTLVGMLADYRGLLAQIENSYRAASFKRYRAFTKNHRATVMRYLLADRFAAHWSWQAPKQVEKVWATVAEEGLFAEMAGFGAARSYYNAGRYDDAVERLVALFARLGDRIRMQAVYHHLNYIPYAFRNSSRGEAGWRLFFGQWRERVLKQNDPGELIALMSAARYTGVQNEMDRLANRLSQIAIDDPTLVLQAATVLQQTGRAPYALSLIESNLEKGLGSRSGKARPPISACCARCAPSLPSLALLRRASQLAEQQGLQDKARIYLERAMERYYRVQVPLHQLRSDYQHLFQLCSLAARRTAAPERTKHADAALAHLAEWRRIDPDNHSIDALASTLLFDLDRDEEAWRYLSTTIERHPMEGSSFSQVAEALEREAMLEHAERLWQRAYQVEPTNPNWLFRRAQVLFARGDNKPARGLLEQITKGKWHERHRNIIRRARNILRRQVR